MAGGASVSHESRPRCGSDRACGRCREWGLGAAVVAAGGVAARSGARHGAAVAARMCARSEAVELEVLGAEGSEARVPPRPLRLSLLELLGKLVRRDQPAQPNRRAKHNHRFRTFVSCGRYLSILRTPSLSTATSKICFARFQWNDLRRIQMLCSRLCG